MSPEEALEYESHVKVRQAVIAALAGVFLLVAAALQVAGPQPKVSELTIDLITRHKRVALDVVAAVISGLGLCALAWTLAFLFGIARARNPRAQPFIRLVAIAGGLLAAIGAIVYPILLATKANQFVTHGSQTYQEAKQLTSGSGLVPVQLAGLLGALLLAVGIVMTSLTAMRVGLLTRFTGYLGIFTGVLVLFPIGSPVPIVQGFWLLSLAYLFTGRWPSGLPPAWSSGKAEPWPSSQEMREQRMKARGQSAGGDVGRPKPERPSNQPEPAPEPVASPTQSRSRASTPKRKRKRRG